MVNAGATIQNLDSRLRQLHTALTHDKNNSCPKIRAIFWNWLSFGNLLYNYSLATPPKGSRVSKLSLYSVVTIRVISTADLCVVQAMLEQKICVLRCTIPSHPQTPNRQVVTEKQRDEPWQVTASNTTWHLISSVFLPETHIHTLASKGAPKALKIIKERRVFGSKRWKRRGWMRRKFSTLKLPYCSILNSMETVCLLLFCSREQSAALTDILFCQIPPFDFMFTCHHQVSRAKTKSGRYQQLRGLH